MNKDFYKESYPICNKCGYPLDDLVLQVCNSCHEEDKANG